MLGGGEDVGGDDLVEQALELAVGQADAVECLELLAEVRFKRGAVADVRAVLVLQAAKLLDKLFFKLAFGRSHCCFQIDVKVTLAVRRRLSALNGAPVAPVRTGHTVYHSTAQKLHRDNHAWWEPHPARVKRAAGVLGKFSFQHATHGNSR